VCSESGKFVCGCGRDYMVAQSLKRHKRNCQEVMVMDETNDDENNDEGIFHFKGCVCEKIWK